MIVYCTCPNLQYELTYYTVTVVFFWPPDPGYKDGNQFSVTPTGNHTGIDRMKSLPRARHEGINSLFKEYGFLQRHFWHHHNLHGRVFTAIANIIQLSIMYQGPTFQVDYYDGREA
jgi:hypothetical protein